MAQIFHRNANTLAPASILAVVPCLPVVGVALFKLQHPPHVTPSITPRRSSRFPSTIVEWIKCRFWMRKTRCEKTGGSMNEELIAILFVLLIAFAYASCAVFKCGTCDVGKCFEGSVFAVGAILGTFVLIHTLTSVRAKKP